MTQYFNLQTRKGNNIGLRKMSRAMWRKNVRRNHNIRSTQMYQAGYVYTITKVIIDTLWRSYISQLSIHTYIKFNLSQQANMDEE